MEKCGCFIALISENYLASSNCKDELNYARELEKPRLLVYLEDVQLPGGMRMRLSRLQAIHKYKYVSETAFMQKLLETKGLESCCEGAYPIVEENHWQVESRTRELSREYKPTNPDADIRLILAVDTSGSMSGFRIEALNKAIRKILEDVLHKYGDTVDVDILQYSTEATWISKSSLPLQASGMTNYSEALKCLLGYEYRFPKCSQCAVVFVTDGSPTDPYQDTLFQLQKENWFYEALKVGIMIGNDESLKDVAAIVDSPNAVVNVSDHSISRVLEAAAEFVITALETRRNQMIIEGNMYENLESEHMNESIVLNLRKMGQ